MNEKAYTAWFPQCCAPTLITRDMADMHAFLKEHSASSASRWTAWAAAPSSSSTSGDKNANVIFETLTEYGTRFAIAQNYLPEIVASGDTRILLIDGEPRRYALARIPSRDRQPRQPRRRRARAKDAS